MTGIAHHNGPHRANPHALRPTPRTVLGVDIVLIPPQKRDN